MIDSRWLGDGSVWFVKYSLIVNMLMLIELSGMRLILMCCCDSCLYRSELRLMLIENVVSRIVMMLGFVDSMFFVKLKNDVRNVVLMNYSYEMLSRFRNIVWFWCVSLRLC